MSGEESRRQNRERQEWRGRGYASMQTGVPLHYGEVEVQVIEYAYELASPANAFEFVPKYSHTTPTPDPTNVCYHQGANPVPPGQNKCADDSPTSECVQLKLSPSPIAVRDVRFVVGPQSTFFAAIGGIVSLAIMLLTAIHSSLVKAFNGKGLCAPAESKGIGAREKGDAQSVPSVEISRA